MLFFLLFVCVGCDQGTKYTAKYFLEGRPTLSYLGDLFRLSYIENSGAFLSLSATLPENIRLILFGVLAAILLFGFLLFVIRDYELNLSALSGQCPNHWHRFGQFNRPDPESGDGYRFYEYRYRLHKDRYF